MLSTVVVTFRSPNTLTDTMASSFRKIDIDAYDEDVLQESELYEPDPRDPVQVLSDTKQKAAAVRSALSRNDINAALSVVLEHAPYGPNVEEAKVRITVFSVLPSRRASCQNLNLQTLITIVNSTKSTEIPAIVKSLSQNEQDTLMKYLYKGMGLPGWGDISESVLLGWHEKVRLPSSIMWQTRG
jgi:actin related protein 2/3 complex, subunit 5